MFLYLTKNWLQLNKDWWLLVITDNETKLTRKIPVNTIEWVVIFWRIQLTTDVMINFLKAKTPVFFLSKKWNYFWKLDSLEIKNIELLYNHIQFSMNEKINLDYSKKIISSKVQNSITMLQRWQRFNFFYQKNIDNLDWYISELKKYLPKIENANSANELRWYEWFCAKIYFQWFNLFLPKSFEFKKRTRRPPLDNINAMLSLWYTLLSQTIQMILSIQWIESQIWFFHTPKDLKSLLVLDIMEMYRAWIIDDMVIRILKKWSITEDDFFKNTLDERKPVSLTEEWLKKFLSEYYKTVFSKADEEQFWNYKKLSIIEKNIETLKQSFIKKDEKIYNWFLIK